ncbi:myelin-oligodendrocyte glycoprotein-like isoform X1 [Mugil cephalus]|uniref:myelin-oligodendrocyte glycoprotein-like isoform X1 n=1 Tax=Mugil cephalus TaxID=48193 RepID=UPI001FB69193|nr:myelin-oligodendrocyte glycoprotein-like isoform X1 [Mugil cephalus]
MAVTTLFAFVTVASLIEKLPIINQTQMIKVPEGSNLTLQCQTDPEINLEDLALDWRRVDIKNVSDRFVYSRRRRTDHPVKQMQRYKNRAELIKEDLTRGRMTLLIPTVQQSDSGHFRCFISNLSVSFVFNINVTKREDVAMTTSTVSGLVEKRSHWITLGVCICVLLVIGFIIGVLVKNRGIRIYRRRIDEEMGMLRKEDEGDKDKDGDKDEDVTTVNVVMNLQQVQL